MSSTLPSLSLVPGCPVDAGGRGVGAVDPRLDGQPPSPAPGQCAASIIGCNDDRSVTVRHHTDAVVEPERPNNTVKFDGWTLLQTASHLKTKPDSSFRPCPPQRGGGGGHHVGPKVVNWRVFSGLACAPFRRMHARRRRFRGETCPCHGCRWPVVQLEGARGILKGQPGRGWERVR